MVFKDVVHGLLVKMYLWLIVFLQRYPGIRARLVRKMCAAREEMRRRTGRLSSVGGRGIKGLQEKMGSTPVLGSVISGGEGL